MDDYFGMAAKRRSTWTEEESKKIFSLCKEGKNLQEIVKHFPKKPKSSIKTKMYAMGFSSRGKQA